MQNIFNYKEARQEGRVGLRGEEAVKAALQLDTRTGEITSLALQWEGEEGSMRGRKSLQVLDDASTVDSPCSHDDAPVRLHRPRRLKERSTESHPHGHEVPQPPADLGSPDSVRMLTQVWEPSLFFTITTHAHQLCILALQQHRAAARSGC